MCFAKSVKGEEILCHFVGAALEKRSQAYLFFVFETAALLAETESATAEGLLKAA